MRIAIKKRMYKKHCGLPFHSMTAETNHYCFRHPNTEESMLQIRTLTLLHNLSQMAIEIWYHFWMHLGFYYSLLCDHFFMGFDHLSSSNIVNIR